MTRAGVAFAALLLISIVYPAAASEPSPWAPATPLHVARVDFAAARLADGSVLVAGGAPPADVGPSSERYDPLADAWNITGDLGQERFGGVLTALPDGRALLTGGSPAPNVVAHTVELFDTATGTWRLASAMVQARRNHAAVLLADGRVLVAGGVTDDGRPIVTAVTEVYDPATDRWTRVGDLRMPRYLATATRLPDGRVLLAGGFTSSQNHTPTRAVELFDPATGRWSAADPLRVARASHSMTMLADGRILVAGGEAQPQDAVTETTETWSPATGRWTTAGPLPVGTRLASAAPFGSGVLTAGGIDGSNALTAAASVFDPATGAWTPLAPLPVAAAPVLITLEDGTVLAIASRSRTITSMVWRIGP